ncbi:hypothetical protein GS4_28_00890 [Gordonia soli NBRC 108243]|uniref:Uncharacterized protein n=1 Tax=Gordonia soli NBRC 108243 TaxID=1223545 RepID=M0QNJ2_9ACTN|nr:hypothetical protein GS4_28_00890 [Gordonia soli NBRC 108243]
MPFVTVGSENDHPVDIHFTDRGSGRPLVLIHGFPLDGASWEPQELAPARHRHHPCRDRDPRATGLRGRIAGTTTGRTEQGRFGGRHATTAESAPTCPDTRRGDRRETPSYRVAHKVPIGRIRRVPSRLNPCYILVARS